MTTTDQEPRKRDVPLPYLTTTTYITRPDGVRHTCTLSLSPDVDAGTLAFAMVRTAVGAAASFAQPVADRLSNLATEPANPFWERTTTALRVSTIDKLAQESGKQPAELMVQVDQQRIPGDVVRAVLVAAEAW